MVHVLATGGVEDHNPFSTWRTLLAEAFVPLECTQATSNPFAGRIEQTAIRSLRISKLTAVSHQVTRLKMSPDRFDDSFVFLNFQLTGHAVTTTENSSFQAGHLDVAVADPARGFSIKNTRGFEVFTFTVPRRSIPSFITEKGGIMLGKGPRSRTLAHMLVNYAELALVSDDLQTSEFIETSIVEILKIASDTVLESKEREGENPTRAWMMMEYIRKNCGDPMLSPTRVASVFGITPRYVHKVISTSGHSFGELLMASRLEKARERLCDFHSKTEPVTQIALECGFSDLSHFSRSFRQRFGETPSNYRRMGFDALGSL